VQAERAVQEAPPVLAGWAAQQPQLVLAVLAVLAALQAQTVLPEPTGRLEYPANLA
jgi:hypothetical protein